MGEALSGRAVSRVNCWVHHKLSASVQTRLRELGVSRVLLEAGRTVRQVVKRRAFGLPGTSLRLDDSPVDKFTFVVEQEHSAEVLQQLIVAADLESPGRGTIFSQDVTQFSAEPMPTGALREADEATGGDGPLNREPSGASLLRDLALVCAIVSGSGAGEQLSQLALELGSCVPVVTRGSGTGVRDRLGLLRITVPAEKEVVSFLVPRYDAESVIRLLAEEIRLDRPGAGFVYQTPVREARLDTKVRIGRQEHAASIDQVIAAIDELKSGTAWRKRFAALEQESTRNQLGVQRANQELVLLCSEGRTRDFVQAALESGAGGATMGRVRRLIAEDESGTAAVERSTMHVPRRISEEVLGALMQTIRAIGDGSEWIEVCESPLAFTHRSSA